MIPGLFVNGLVVHTVGWFVTIFGSVGAVAVFTYIDLRRRSSRSYIGKPKMVAILRVAALVTGTLVAMCFAYLIADEVARWDLWF